MFTKDKGEIPETFKLHVTSSLSPELKNKIEQFRTTVSDMSGQIRTPQEEMERFEKYYSDKDAKKWIIVLNKNDLIGMTVIYGREILYSRQAIALGGIGKVRVREDWRKKGIAKMMMEEATRQLIAMKYDVAFLATNIDSFLGDFYRQYGFVALNKQYNFLGYSGKHYEEHDGMIAPVSSKTIFQKILDGKEPLDIGRGTW